MEYNAPLKCLCGSPCQMWIHFGTDEGRPVCSLNLLIDGEWVEEETKAVSLELAKLDDAFSCVKCFESGQIQGR